MERRNRSLESLNQLRYLGSLEPEDRAEMLSIWVETYMDDVSIDNLELSSDEINELSEMFFKNIAFMKEHREYIKEQLDSHNKIKQFLVNSN